MINWNFKESYATLWDAFSLERRAMLGSIILWEGLKFYGILYYSFALIYIFLLIRYRWKYYCIKDIKTV